MGSMPPLQPVATLALFQPIMINLELPEAIQIEADHIFRRSTTRNYPRFSESREQMPNPLDVAPDEDPAAAEAIIALKPRKERV